MADYNGVRISMAHKTESAWNAMTSFVPKKGEIIVYDTDSINLKVRHKIGDGITLLSNLPFEGNPLPDIELTDKGKYLHINESTGELEWSNTGSGGGDVQSVNGKTGVVVLDAGDVGALPSTTPIPTKTSDLTNDSGFITNSYHDATKQNLITNENKLNYSLISNTPNIPTKTSDLVNDSGFLTQHQDISGKVDKVAGKGLSTNDYTTAEKEKLSGIEEGAEVNVQSDWNAVSGDAFIKNKPTIPIVNDATLTIKQGGVTKGTFSANSSTNTTINLEGSDLIDWDDITNKPSTFPPSSHNHDDRYYTESEIDNLLNDKADIVDIPTKTSDLTNDSGFLTQHQDISGKQDILVSGTNIKTINSQSLLGAGNIDVEGGGGVQTFVQNTEPQDAQIGDIWVNPDEISSIADYIVEQGTSGIWTYRKWNSGIAECWGNDTRTFAVNTARGSVYMSAFQAMTYPSGLFTEEPTYNVFVSNDTSAHYLWLCIGRAASATSTGNMYVVCATSQSSVTATLSCRAEGRWK